MGKRRSTFGSVRRLPSGKWQARYTVPGSDHMEKAPTTFRTSAEAHAWLRREAVRIEAETAGSPRAAVRRTPTLAEWVERWMQQALIRPHKPLRPSTAHTYRSYLRNHVLPVLGDKRLSELTTDVIEEWHRSLAPGAPTVRARVYAFLKTVLGAAVEEGVIPMNPCRLKGASTAHAVTEVSVLEPAQVRDLAAEMPDRLALAVLLGAFGQLRVGEALALRRQDLDVPRGIVRVRRGVTWQGPTCTFGEPKTKAGIRDVHLPASVVAAVEAHLGEHVAAGRGALLFPREPGAAVPVRLDSFTQTFKRAARRADLPEATRFHHLRHSGLSMLAEAGASVAELQARAGHSTPGIALRYQHARTERDRSLAQRLDVVME